MNPEIKVFQKLAHRNTTSLLNYLEDKNYKLREMAEHYTFESSIYEFNHETTAGENNANPLKWNSHMILK